MRRAMRKGEIDMRKATQRDCIVVYGAGECGEAICKQFRNAGYTVVGFIDRKKRGELCGLPIEGSDSGTYKRSAIVFIALSNGNLHMSVTRQLFREGYQYVICLPLGFGLSSDKQNEIIRNYADCMCGKMQNIWAYEKEDLVTDFFIEQNKLLDSWDEKELKVIWVGKNIVFSEAKDKYPGDIERLPNNPELFDFPVALRKPYYILYDYFDGKPVDVNGYFSIYKEEPSSERKRDILAERYELFKLMKKEKQQGNLSFFENSAPTAQWNEKGYFNLVGGHHRTTFLIHQGMESVPILVNKKDYISWCNLEAITRHKDLLFEKQSRVNFDAPFFRYRLSEYQVFEQNVYDKVLEQLWALRKEHGAVLDASTWDGMFALAAKRLGYTETAVSLKDSKYVEAIFDVLGVSGIRFSKECEAEYDIVFELGDDRERTEKKGSTEYLKKAHKYCKKHLFFDMVQVDVNTQDIENSSLIDSVSILGQWNEGGNIRNLYWVKYIERKKEK